MTETRLPIGNTKIELPYQEGENIVLYLRGNKSGAPKSRDMKDTELPENGGLRGSDATHASDIIDDGPDAAGHY